MVTHDSEDDLAKSLPVNAAIANELGLRIVAADNASRDNTIDLLATYGVKVVQLSDNRGYAAGVNAAVSAVPPDLDVLLINPDVTLDGAASVTSLSEELHSRERAAVVAPALIDADGERQLSARRFPSGAAMIASLPVALRSERIRRTYDDYMSPTNSEGSAMVDWVIGAAMLLRRRALDELGGWDEDYFLYMEDADYCRRAWRSGWEVWYLTEIQVRHNYRRASSAPGASVISSVARRRHIRSLARFYAKHPSVFLGLGPRRS